MHHHDSAGEELTGLQCRHLLVPCTANHYLTKHMDTNPAGSLFVQGEMPSVRFFVSSGSVLQQVVYFKCLLLAIYC